MAIFLYLFSLVWIVSGACFILYTHESRGFVRQLFDDVDRRILSAIAGVLGVALLFASPYSAHSWFVVLLGLLSLIKGGFFFFAPADLFEPIRRWYVGEATDQTYRFFGILMLVLGTALVSWVI